MANREDIRNSLSYKLHEVDSGFTAENDLIGATQKNEAILMAIRKLPSYGVYLEKMYTISLSSRLDYPLPSGVLEVEEVEVNRGSSSNPDWQEIKGTDVYANTLWLPYLPTSTDTMRLKTQKAFTELTDDVTVTDIPNNKLEILIKLATLYCYENLIGYFLDSKNWDAVAKPEGADMNKLHQWYRTAKTEWEKEAQKFRRYPKPRMIDLVG